MPLNPSKAAGPQHRWDQVLAIVAGLLPASDVSVVIDGGGRQPAIVADRLEAVLQAGRRPCARLTGIIPRGGESPRPASGGAATVWLADGPAWRTGHRCDVLIWLRTSRATQANPAQRDCPGDAEARADIVIDLHDPQWPVIRHVAVSLADDEHWYLSETGAFFAVRAATWDTKFGDDLPGYSAAIAQARIPVGGIAIDVGCGTGRALPALREAVGPDGTVIALDLTPEMLAQARIQGRGTRTALILADARQLPFPNGCADAVFAAGLINHLPDTEAGLRQLSRVTRPEGVLILFHPSGRAELAARHGRTLQPDEPLAETPLRQAMRSTGWHLATYDDAAHRFLAIGTRQ